MYASFHRRTGRPKFLTDRSRQHRQVLRRAAQDSQSHSVRLQRRRIHHPRQRRHPRPRPIVGIKAVQHLVGTLGLRRRQQHLPQRSRRTPTFLQPQYRPRRLPRDIEPAAFIPKNVPPAARPRRTARRIPAEGDRPGAGNGDNSLPGRVAPESAITASLVTTRRFTRSVAARISRLSSGPPLIPKHAASKRTVARPIRPAAQAAATLPVTARSRLPRPSPARRDCRDRPPRCPESARFSSPMIAVVPDCPPSTPRNNLMAVGTVSCLYHRPPRNPHRSALQPQVGRRHYRCRRPAGNRCPGA